MGLATGLLMPYVALWVTQRLHGTTFQAAFIFVPFGLVGVSSNLAAGSYSDRLGRRKGMILLALLVGGSARVALAFVSHYGTAVALYALMGFSPFGLFFALLRDTIRSKQAAGKEKRGSEAFLTTLVRTLFSLGWLVGPVLGGLLAEIIGYRGLFALSGVLVLSAGAWAWSEIAEKKSHAEHRRSLAPPIKLGEVALLFMLFFVGLFLLAGDTGRSTFMALYLTRSLSLPVSDVSWAFSTTVLAELLFMPLAGRLADRFGVAGVMIAGASAQALYFFGMTEASAYWMVLLLQVLYAFVVSTSSGVAILFAQQTITARRTGLSTSTYLVSRGLAPVVNSLLVGIGFIAADLGRLFAVFGFFACAALLLVLAVGRGRTVVAGRARQETAR